MRTESPTCITHPATCAVVLLREDFLAICDANHCAAFVLAQMDYWHYIKVQHRPQARAYNDIQERAGQDATQSTELWVYKTQLELCAELLGLYSDKTVREAFKVLLAKGYLRERANPDFALDRTKQFLFVTRVVQDAVNAWAESGAPRAMKKTASNGNGSGNTEPVKVPNAAGKSSASNPKNGSQEPVKVPFASGTSSGAIPEITSEITSETTPENLSAPAIGTRDPRVRVITDAISLIAGELLNYRAEGAAAKRLLAHKSEPTTDEIICLYEHWFNRRDVVKYGNSLTSFGQVFPTMLLRLRAGVPLDTGSAPEGANGSGGLQAARAATAQRVRDKEAARMVGVSGPALPSG